MSKKISDSTISRLSRYYRTLDELIEKGVHTISSGEIADINSITSAQFRKDLSFFGSFGKRGTGYNTKALQDEIGKILGLTKTWNVGLVGFGNIGKALIHYEEFVKQGFRIIAIFDNDPSKIKKNQDGTVVYDIKDAKKMVEKLNLEIIINAVPARFAQNVIDVFINCGIKAFLNFAQTSIKVPQDVLVKNENMSIELEALSYYLSKRK